MPLFVKGMIAAYIITAFFVFLFVACEDIRIGKTREELSVSASKSIKKENIEIVVSFK